MNQPIFVHLNPQAGYVYLPDVALLPPHPNKEADALYMIQEHGF